jgi:glutamate N-acetyltransferase/amino-acid N-acetyltransferase
MMTTDTAPKEAAVRVKGYTIGGAAKGSGMIHPTLATMLCFLTTDAGVDKVFLGEALRKATDISFNMVTVDGDTSPNDMVLLLANGRAGSEIIAQNSRAADNFQEALNQVCIRLAKAVAADGEGATKLIEVTVSGAATAADARSAARTVAGSSLVKTAVHGSDPNWGRILAAAGRSGARMAASKIDLSIGDICLVRGGGVLPFDEGRAAEALSGREVAITLDLNLGNDQATAWGCDLSQEYVTINSRYTT